MHIGKSNAQHNYITNNDGFNHQQNKCSLERDVWCIIANDMKWLEQVRAATDKANMLEYAWDAFKSVQL
jgi:hypothetical protein